MTNSPYIAFVDSDVMLPTNWLVDMMQFLLAHPHFVAGESRIRPVKKFNNIFTKAQVTKSLDESILPRFERGFGVGLNSCACLYERSILTSHGGFDEELNSYEDIDLAHRVFYNAGNLFSLKDLEVEKLVSTKNSSQFFSREFTKGFYFHKLHKKRQKSISLNTWKAGNYGKLIALKSRLNFFEFVYVCMLYLAAFNLGLFASLIMNVNYGNQSYPKFYSHTRFNNKFFGLLYFNSSFWCYNPQEKIKIKISEELMKNLYKAN